MTGENKYYALSPAHYDHRRGRLQEMQRQKQQQLQQVAVAAGETALVDKVSPPEPIYSD